MFFSSVTETAKQNQKYSFPFAVTHSTEKKEGGGKFLVFAYATTGSGRGAHHWSSGVNSKYIRTSFNTHSPNKI
ncbi:MAG: hypothetical protein UY04_C0033G0014 [Parcubacteria group bacterium GW2011_GWA2_47_7]|nr:MAG: hypothetical protein UY04_C0033G0014 [Parcubacteria group bacterium GW2011_GWA2_47_7]